MKLRIVGADGTTLRELDTETTAGLHVARWDLRRVAQRPAGARGAGPFRGRGSMVRPGEYAVELSVNGEITTRPITVEIDPQHTDPSWISFEEEAEEFEFLDSLENEEEGESSESEEGVEL
ncbi:MAG: hypothetical protein AAF488_19590 [Planctomycetota bacterium]